MSLFFTMLLMYVIPTVVIASPIWFFSRHRVHWSRWNFFALLIPFLLWIFLVSINLKSKSLSNAGIEPLILGILVSVAQIFPVIIPEIHGSYAKSSLVTLLLTTVITFLIYFLVPSLPE